MHLEWSFNNCLYWLLSLAQKMILYLRRLDGFAQIVKFNVSNPLQKQFFSCFEHTIFQQPLEHMLLYFLLLLLTELIELLPKERITAVI